MSDHPRTTIEHEERGQFIAGLVAMADLLAKHPDINVNFSSAFDLFVYADNAEALRKKIRALGPSEKWSTDHSVGVRRAFGPHHVTVFAAKSVTCQRVVTGRQPVTRTAQKRDELPADAREVREVTVIQYTIDQDQVEWVCPDSLLAATAGKMQ